MTDAVVYIVDDDAEVLKGLERLLEVEGLATAAFDSPHAFLDRVDASAAGCLVLDLSMPGLSGLDLQQVLSERGIELPVIFLTARGDIPATVRAMKSGATDFLTKPVDREALLAAIRSALDKDRVLREARHSKRDLEARFATLTAKEREVLLHVVAGRLNKQVAADLGKAEKTVKFHRANVMRKLGVRSVADLVRLASKAGIKPAG